MTKIAARGSGKIAIRMAVLTIVFPVVFVQHQAGRLMIEIADIPITMTEVTIAVGFGKCRGSLIPVAILAFQIAVVFY